MRNFPSDVEQTVNFQMVVSGGWRESWNIRESLKNRTTRGARVSAKDLSQKILAVVEHYCELNSCLERDTIANLRLYGAAGSADITPLLHDIWQSHRCQIVLENVLGFVVSAEIFPSFEVKNRFVPLVKLLLPSRGSPSASALSQRRSFRLLFVTSMCFCFFFS